MLRCFMPTVRAVGGRGNALFNIRTISTSRLAPKLTTERPTWSLCNTSTSLPHLNDAQNGEQTPDLVDDLPVRYEQVAFDGCTIPSDISSQPSIGPSSTTDVTAVPPSEVFAGQPTFIPNTRAITVLKTFLSSDNLASPEPTVHTANTIQSLFRSAQARDQLKALDVSEFSALISIFGSLSLSPLGLPYCSIYAHPFISAILNIGSRENQRSYWALVIWLLRQKVSLYAKLGPSDHYYAMRAHLAELDATISQGQPAELSYGSKALLRSARKHYKSLARSMVHPDAHLPYLRTLITLPGLADEAMEATNSLISRQSYSNSELLSHLWQLALLPPSQSTGTARSDLLQTISSRAQRTMTILATKSIPDTPDAPQDTQPPSIDDLLYSLTHAISCDIRPRSLAHNHRSYLLRWSLEVVLSELSPAANAAGFPEPAWAQLRYIAAAHNLSPKELEDMMGADSGGSWSWKAICVLARLKQLLDGNESEDFYYGRVSGIKPESLLEPLRTLWNKWTTACPSEPPLFRPVFPVIVAGFFELARRSGDGEFVELAWSFLTRGNLLSNRDVAVEYCVAGIVSNLEARELLPAILAHVLPASRSVVLKDVIVRLVHIDLALARAVCAVAEGSRLVVEQDALVALARKLADVGHLEEALVFVSDSRLQASIKLDILTVILQRSCRAPSNFPIRRLFAGISKAISTLVSSHRAPIAAEEGFEESLLVTLTIYRLSRLPSILRTLHKFWPRFFSHRFQLAAAEELIRQRQFQTAMHLLRHATLDEDSRRRILLSLIRGGASRLASRFLSCHGRASDRSLSLESLVRAARLQHANVPRLHTLKASRSILKTLHPAEAALAMKLLTSAGRVRAGELLFDARHRWVVKADDTAIGNTLIHASMTGGSRRRRARQLQRTLQMMNRLANEQGFAPDRVTVNILLKAILRWSKAVDTQAIRALFDRMIRSGYPVGDAFPPGVVPFRTDVASGEQFGVPELSSPISYSAHVVPLYKMFIKALYVRRDVDGAKTIVGILKGLEATERLQRGQRALVKFRNKRR